MHMQISCGIAPYPQKSHHDSRHKGTMIFDNDVNNSEDLSQFRDLLDDLRRKVGLTIRTRQPITPQRPDRY